ncbi:MAG: virulence protein RhuM/Fic/DOC family protein [Flavobacteriales bacterium]|nr:virulence protein RhuM/Fic/DOC family protein [Flavobacteriales bacterium]
MQKGEIQIYKTIKGTEIEVSLENDSIWLDAHIIATLFNVQRPAIVKHINNIYKAEELKRNSTCSILEQVASDGKKRKMNLYNLDMIISIGYRVNSKQATEFRQWATQKLKDFLVKGYVLNERKLKETQQQFVQLQQSIKLLENVVNQKQLNSDEATSLLKVITEYSHALNLLDQYDHQKLTIEKKEDKEINKLTYKEAIDQIKIWRDSHNGGALFGNEKDASFKSSLETIYQTFDGIDLYPSIEEKAANLLYFVVKNHSFSDGNKRIAAGLFVFFLDKNRKLYNSEGSKIIADNALVAITIMIAESNTEEKDVMIKLIVNLMLS